ncbi:hypothetical protein NLJ89_g1116 [Agrocybe chaxingu]|uniref:Uncharacterized protein n=1 Tax=Agrocybe chaxingu TaxID=84603 RepID=A0A9W8TEY9_9AGAR|nr:hypothetical protein NLJ89_g1116 [Agrocybe chaxingu]
MLSSLHHTQDDNDDDHLRVLIDQRFARADVHGHFSSAASEYPDSPSVYSRSYFSPKSSHAVDYDYPSPISPTYPRGPDHDQATSMLDLSDDPRSSIATSAGYDHGTAHEDAEEDDDSSPTTRMSYLGPKMRFHSRAPWEMDGGVLEEDEETEAETRRFPAGFPFSLSSSTKNGTSSSSSPRPSYAGRPSAESARSQVPPKRSFDTITSQISYPRGALYALAQESMSTHSLGRPSAPPQRETLRNKFSLGRLRSDSSSTAPPPVPSPVRTPVNHRFPSPAGASDLPTSPLDSPNPNAPFVRNTYPAQPEDAFHPYANPDLIVSYAEEQAPAPTSRTSNYLPTRNESSVTVAESLSADSMSRTTVRSNSATLTPDTSINSVSSRQRISSINPKTISSPVSVVRSLQRVDSPASDMRQEQTATMPPPGVSHLHGWTERQVAPAFSLISLEEARAQRMRSSTVLDSSRISTSSGIDASSASCSGEAESSTSATMTEYPLGNMAARARGRSISAGSKAKNAFQTIVGQPKMERRDSEPSVVPQQGLPGKTLKHKKSGFMRLFNAGKAQEKDGRESPPPVPSLPDHTNQSQPLQRTPKSTVTRVPVPSFSSSLLEAVDIQRSNPSTNEGGDSWKPNLFSPRRVPPALSISTAPGASARVPGSVFPDRAQQGMSMGGLQVEKPWSNNLQPQSAPANVSEFPALKLRPVSTVFSAQFGDHIVSAESRSSDETTDLDTPRSPSPTGIMSPVTPGFSRSSNEQPQITVTGNSDDSSAVRALQGQFVTAKKAWQRQVQELECQVRDLKIELEELKNRNSGDYCQSCGRGDTKDGPISTPATSSVINRPRARTGTSSRFGSVLP